MLRDASDGLPARVVGEWSEEKLFVLARYIDTFTTAMRGKWDRLVYVDLFCGPGCSIIENSGREIAGSPLLALGTRYPFSQLYFSDVDSKATHALRQRITRSKFADRCIVETLDCGAAASDARKRLFLPGTRTLGLAFIDPTAFQIGLDALRTLTSDAPIDVIITVMTGYMRRFINEPSFEAPLDRYFGSSGWRSLAGSGSSEQVTSRALLDYYEDRLRELNYAHFNDDVRIENSVGRAIYHLVFASRHELGGQFWAKISRRKLSGQGRLDV